jgi:ethanolamine utilization protein EutA
VASPTVGGPLAVRPPQGRFTAPGRSIAVEDRVVLVSVGVDIGSSTSHLLFSRLELERVDSRYVTTRREVLFESEILLTPYLDDVTIDQTALGSFIKRQYDAAGIDRAAVDTGALILTGVALERHNARAVADLFAQDAGRFVAVSAGDNLEAVMAAHGSGALVLSESVGGVMNIDIGGGTTKVVVCRDGYADEVMAIDVGARLVAYDSDGIVTRLEGAALKIGERCGINLALGRVVTKGELETFAATMVDVLLSAVGPHVDGRPAAAPDMLRTPGLRNTSGISAVTFSGGVAEYIHGRIADDFGDLGPLLACELRSRRSELIAPVLETSAGIRATVIGASQHTVQVSGSTVCISPLEVLPIQNVPVVSPRFTWGSDGVDAGAVSTALRDALYRSDLLDAAGPVAIATRWSGSVTFAGLRSFAAGITAALASHISAGHPVILVFDGDIGGLVGLHLLEDTKLVVPVISIDGVDLREFDYIDIGELIPTSGAVPLVIKSLVFSAAPTIHDHQEP